MATPPEFTVGVDARGRLICQEENLEPSILKELDNYFLTVNDKFCTTFTLAADAVDTQVTFGTITSAKVIFIFSTGDITYKLNSIGSAAVPCNPYTLVMGSNAGITELYLTNLTTDVTVTVFVGA